MISQFHRMCIPFFAPYPSPTVFAEPSHESKQTSHANSLRTTDNGHSNRKHTPNPPHRRPHAYRRTIDLVSISMLFRFLNPLKEFRRLGYKASNIISQDLVASVCSVDQMDLLSLGGGLGRCLFFERQEGRISRFG
jgi:hypothetical protein